MRPAAHATLARYTVREEIAHGITHGVGALLAVAALTILVAKAAVWGDTRAVVAAAIFGTSLFLMYTASTVFHALPHSVLPDAKHLLRILDHSMIYVLIAGTYTPFTLITLRGPWGWGLFAFTWGLATVGVIFKLFTTGRFERLSTIIYLLMGWCGLVAAKQLMANLPMGGQWWLLAGGLSYSFGVIFYVAERLRYHHAIWHLFVLGGSVCHFFSILLYVLPGAPPPA
jgi:hemolysin III